MIEASRPSTRPSASISSHFLSISDGLAEKVFIAPDRSNGRPRRAWPTKGGHVGDWPGEVKQSLPFPRHRGDPTLKPTIKGIEAATTAMPRITENASVLLEESDLGALPLSLNQAAAR